MRRVRWLFLLPVAANTVVAIAFLGTAGYLIAVNIAAAIVIAIFLLLIRVDPPSRTVKSAEYVLEANPRDVLARSFAVLTSCGARIGRYDEGEGLIQASTSLTWRSFGEVLTVRVWEAPGGKTRLRFESDAVQPSVILDWGANARNVDRFQAGLLTTAAQPTRSGGA
jgi:hypothetical protein